YDTNCMKRRAEQYKSMENQALQNKQPIMVKLLKYAIPALLEISKIRDIDVELLALLDIYNCNLLAIFNARYHELIAKTPLKKDLAIEIHNYNFPENKIEINQIKQERLEIVENTPQQLVEETIDSDFSRTQYPIHARESTTEMKRSNLYPLNTN